MNDDELRDDELDNDTHIEDSREPASLEDDDESLIGKVKDAFSDEMMKSAVIIKPCKLISSPKYRSLE